MSSLYVIGYIDAIMLTIFECFGMIELRDWPHTGGVKGLNIKCIPSVGVKANHNPAVDVSIEIHTVHDPCRVVPWPIVHLWEETVAGCSVLVSVKHNIVKFFLYNMIETCQSNFA